MLCCLICGKSVVLRLRVYPKFIVSFEGLSEIKKRIMDLISSSNDG